MHVRGQSVTEPFNGIRRFHPWSALASGRAHKLTEPHHPNIVLVNRLLPDRPDRFHTMST